MRVVRVVIGTSFKVMITDTKPKHLQLSLSPELAALREADDVKPVLQVWIASEVLADHVDLIVDIHEEAILHVRFHRVANLDGLDVDPWHLLLHLVDQPPHAEAKATAVT